MHVTTNAIIVEAIIQKAPGVRSPGASRVASSTQPKSSRGLRANPRHVAKDLGFSLVDTPLARRRGRWARGRSRRRLDTRFSDGCGLGHRGRRRWSRRRPLLGSDPRRWTWGRARHAFRRRTLRRRGRPGFDGRDDDLWPGGRRRELESARTGLGEISYEAVIDDRRGSITCSRADQSGCCRDQADSSLSTAHESPPCAADANIVQE